MAYDPGSVLTSTSDSILLAAIDYAKRFDALFSHIISRFESYDMQAYRAISLAARSPSPVANAKTPRSPTRGISLPVLGNVSGFCVADDSGAAAGAGTWTTAMRIG